jgi:hypothetical protein
LNIANNSFNDNGEGSIYFYNSATNTTSLNLTTSVKEKSGFFSPTLVFAISFFIFCLFYLWIIRFRKKT